MHPAKRAFLRMEAPQEPKTNVVLFAGNIGTGCVPTPQEVTGNHLTIYYFVDF